MKTIANAIGSLLLITVLIITNGCAEIGPVHRKPLTVAPLQTSLAPNPEMMVVRFNSTLPGVPLSETVWDNVHGAFASAKESKQIGYSDAWSPAIGMAANLVPNSARIVIPFGRILHGVLESGFQKVFPNSLVLSDDSPQPENTQVSAPRYAVRIVVKEFAIWEQPLNHINLRAIVQCSACRAGRTEPDCVYEVRREIINQSIGSAFQTASGAIKEMNRISNELAAAVSDDILGKLTKAVEN